MSWGVIGASVRFGQRTALQDVSLEARPGEVTAVVGGDGAGKTTLLRVLVGALAPDAGEVRRPDPRRIGYLASSSGTYPDLSVSENLAFAATVYGVPVAEARERIAGYLDRAGLAAAGDRLAGNLSGGMRQKLGVIRAMLHRPDLLVLDEPTTGVDPVSRADLWWLIARAAGAGAAVVLASSYLDEAERAPALVVLDAGRALAHGSPAEIAAGTPGTIRAASERPGAEVAARAWQRGTTWRVWDPDTPSAGASGSDRIEPDLQDAVIVAALAHELGHVQARTGAP